VNLNQPFTNGRHVCDGSCETFALSCEQQPIWLLERVHPGTLANRLTYAFRVLDELSVPDILASMQAVVDRHPMLRATFGEVGGAPVQTVHRRLVADCTVESCAGWDDRRLSERLAAHAMRPFDLGDGPPVRFVLLSRSPSEHVLVLSVHHLVSDLWSLALIGYELTTLYRLRLEGGGACLGEPRGRYADFVRGEQDMLAGAKGADHLAFWRKELSGAPSGVGLRADGHGRGNAGGRGALHSFTIPAERARALRRLAAECSSTLHDVVLAAYQVVLHRHSGETDIVVGCMRANRTPSMTRVVGCFVNPVAVRTDFSDDPAFAEVVSRVHRTVRAASQHGAYPSAKVVDALGLGDAPSRGPYFQAVFSWQRTTHLVGRDLSAAAALATSGTERSINGLRCVPLPFDTVPAPFAMTLRVGEVGEELVATIEYSVEAFDAGTVARMADHLDRLLAAALADPTCRVGVLPMLSGPELAELETWAGPPDVGTRGALAVARFEAAVRAAPGAVAVRAEDERVSYGELNARANRLARRLVAAGAGPGALVGVWLERSCEMVVALLAVLKSGAAFVPLDPAFPADRLRFMVADSGARVVVTDASLLAGGDLGAEPEYVCVDRDAAVVAGHADGDLGVAVTDSDLAYVIYTSGSTGRPKGVQVEHGSLANFLEAMAERPGLAAGDVVAAVTTLSFDIALLELLLPLVVGAEVVVLGRATATDGAALAGALARSGATVLQATPSMWRMLVEAGWRGDGRLRALCGGEAMPRDLADELLARCGSVWNMYGPTETTVWSAVAEVGAGEGPVPIGPPVANTRLYVLDPRLQLVPVGVPGELCIGGQGVARGYLGRPELTAERFVPDPFHPAPGARMYRTGDLVRRLPGGDIEFLGRMDAQLKVRGYRIEPGEVESALVAHPGVAQAVVTAHDYGPGDTRLAAYIVPAAADAPPSPPELRAHLRTTLPDYMVPVAYVAVPALPMTPNHKVDRARLPKPDLAAPAAGSGAPRPGLEADLAAIWEQVLGVEGIGRDDDFFDLGGHSLLALRVFARVEALTGRRPPLSALFRAPTVAMFAALLGTDDDASRWTSLVPVQTAGGRPPFFYVSPFLITALSFSALGQRLGRDQPLYVVQPQGMDHDLPFHTTVEEMAAHYVAEVKEVQPAGPYWLGGHCAGSWVAFEMARQLQAQGDEIGLLVLVDAEPPGIEPVNGRGPWYVVRRAAHYLRDGRLLDAVRWKLAVALDRTVVTRAAAPRGERRRLAALRAVHSKAHGAYRGGTVRGDAMLIRSSEHDRDRTKDWYLRWDRLITGQLEVVVVPGTHSALSQDEAAAALASAIRAAMDARGGALGVLA
jgi:amino acid adenylation domain-containing protein